MKYYIDIDGTICDIRGMDYKYYSPKQDVISKINVLYDLGEKIIMYTSRGSASGRNWEEFTRNQLNDWGVKYHELIMGKPSASIYIDDKAANILDFNENKSIAVMVIGAKGSGKTEVRKEFEKLGYYPVYNEKKYVEFGELYPEININSNERVQDYIYEDMMSEIVQASFCRGDVAYEATGTNPRWAMLKEQISRLFRVVVVKVVCDETINMERLQERSMGGHYPFSREHVLDVMNRIKQIDSDYIVDNSGKLEDLPRQIFRINNLIKGYKLVAVSGGFDPMTIGHRDLFKEAKALGDKLVVLLNTDDFLIKKKGYWFYPFEERKAIIESVRYVDRVEPVIDKDNTVRETLRKIHPNIFAVGGDRTGNTHKDVCAEIGCTIVSGLGKHPQSHSSNYIEALVEKLDYIIERRDSIGDEKRRD